jgi:transcription antitermination protein NusB
MKSARRRARELALQALYQWQLSGQTTAYIEKQFVEGKDYAKADQSYFGVLFPGTVKESEHLQAALTPCLDRKFAELSPIERGILLLAGFELVHQIDIPYRVVINEAVELAKSFGGTDGHKYVNGVLDKFAASVRSVEINAR